MGLLGIVNPGFWVLGAGLELGYLLTVSTNQRFQRAIDAQQKAGSTGDWERKIGEALESLEARDRDRYQAFAERCQSIIELQQQASPAAGHGLEAQTESLGRLSWMYLRLLLARHVIEDVIGHAEADAAGDLHERLANLERRAKDERLDEELRRSLTGQIEILKQRIDRRSEAERKLSYIEAELARMEQQVELIREQAALSTDPETLSQRIDDITATLGGTSQWIRDQQKVYGAMEDLLSEAPPVATGTRARESQ
jgi:chromosome segregation ATPase